MGVRRRRGSWTSGPSRRLVHPRRRGLQRSPAPTRRGAVLPQDQRRPSSAFRGHRRPTRKRRRGSVRTTSSNRSTGAIPLRDRPSHRTRARRTRCGFAPRRRRCRGALRHADLRPGPNPRRRTNRPRARDDHQRHWHHLAAARNRLDPPPMMTISGPASRRAHPARTTPRGRPDGAPNRPARRGQFPQASHNARFSPTALCLQTPARPRAGSVLMTHATAREANGCTLVESAKRASRTSPERHEHHGPDGRRGKAEPEGGEAGRGQWATGDR